MRWIGIFWVGLLFIPGVSWAQEGSFTQNNITLKYQTYGKESAEPVVLLHGFVVSGTLQWTAPGITNKLAENYRVVVCDHRGHGRSSRPVDDKAYGLEMVHDVARLMKHLNIEKAHVVGYSMGAFIAHKFAALYPDKAKSIVIGGAGWLKEGLPTSVMDSIAESLESGKGLAPLFQNIHAKNAPPPSKEAMDRVSSLAMVINNPKALACVARGMKQFTLTEKEVESIQAPSLCLVGDQDPLSEMAKILEDKRPQLKVVYLKNADHVGAYARKDFLRNLEDFLGAQSGKK